MKLLTWDTISDLRLFILLFSKEHQEQGHQLVR